MKRHQLNKNGKHLNLDIFVLNFKIVNFLEALLMPGFLLDRNGIVKSCDPRWFQLIAERLITIENENFTEIASDLQRKRFSS